MKAIKVYGSGCVKCRTTAEMIKAEATRLGVEIDLAKVTDPAEAVMAGIMATPAVMVDGVVVHRGGVPKTDAIDGWLLDARGDGASGGGSKG